jgi:hypothetical protein
MVLTKRRWLVIRPALKIQCAKIMVTSLTMAVVLTILKGHMAPYMDLGQFMRFSALIIMSLIGGASYIVMAYFLNTMGMRHWLKERLKKS